MSIRVVCPEGHPVVVEACKLGGAVVCPHCYASFPAEMYLTPARHARKAESKSSRSDDEDDEEEERPQKKIKAKRPRDDDEEEERPQKKTKAKKPKDEEETPKRKNQTRKQEDDDEEDEEEAEEKEEDDDEEAEEERPIEWTARKRQLNVCSNGVLAMTVGVYCLAAFAGFTALWVAFHEMDLFDGGRPWMVSFFDWLSIPLLYLGIAAFTVGMFLSLRVPAKAEGRGPIIAALIFSGLVFFLGLLTILGMYGTLSGDEERASRFVQLLVGSSSVCFILFLVSTKAYLAKLMIFMKMHLESSQPITNAGFILLSFVGMLLLVMISPVLKTSIAPWMCYVVALAFVACAGFGIRTLIVDAKLLTKIRDTIGKYIKDEA
jgi:hypothetical protein